MGSGARSWEGTDSSQAFKKLQVPFSWCRALGLRTCVNNTACLAINKLDFFSSLLCHACHLQRLQEVSQVFGLTIQGDIDSTIAFPQGTR